MGRQVRFHSDRADVLEFERFLTAHGTAIIERVATSPAPVVVPDLRDAGFLLLARAGHLDGMRWLNSAEAGRVAVDQHRSSVIGYSAGHTTDGRPRFVSGRGPGRLWFPTSWWDADREVHADPEFVTWADGVLRWVRRHWTPIEGDHFSPTAAELFHATWNLVLDVPYDGPGADQTRQWRREYDPDGRLPPERLRTVVTRTTRDRPRRLQIRVHVEDV